MFLEAFHRLLKVIYLHHKQNRRLDHLLVTLIKIARDKTFERLHKIEKGKNSHRISEINKRHKSATEMKTYCCSELNDNTGWKVGSKKQDIQLYAVLKEVEDCDCKTRCSTCGVCIHMYSCTCMDATIHTTVCKHIHYVQIAVLGCKSLNTQQIAPMHKEEVDYFSHVLSSSSHQPLLQTKAKLQYSLRDLKEMVEKCE